MRTFLFTLLASLAFLFSSCMKHAEDYIPEYGTAFNTWTFTDGSKNYSGHFATTPVLHTTIQSNNTYTLEMTGTEKSSGQLITMAISLADLDFTPLSYQSGISGSDHATSFYFSGSAGSRDAIYSSTNTDPGAVMTYTISKYDAANDITTISFSGQVFDAGGNKINITKGKMTTRITRK